MYENVNWVSCSMLLQVQVAANKLLFLLASRTAFRATWALFSLFSKLEALRERRPPWPRQIITPILSTVKMLSLGCERLPTYPPKKKKKKKKKKGSGSLPSPRSGYATTITVFFCSFTHLTIPRSPPKFNQFLLVLLRTRP